MDYKTLEELIADGFEKTPQVFHSGKGDGYIYGKSVANENGDGGFHYVYFSVDPEFVVAPFELAISPKVELAPEAVTPTPESTPVVTPGAAPETATEPTPESVDPSQVEPAQSAQAGD